MKLDEHREAAWEVRVNATFSLAAPLKAEVQAHRSQDDSFYYFVIFMETQRPSLSFLPNHFIFILSYFLLFTFMLLLFTFILSFLAAALNIKMCVKAPHL